MFRFSRTECLFAVLFLALAASGCGNGDEKVTLPSGTPVVVSLTSTSRSDWVEPGQIISATVAEDVVFDGSTVLPRGQMAQLVVMDAKVADEAGPARLQLELASIDIAGGTTALQTDPIDIVGEATPTDVAVPYSESDGDDSHAAASPETEDPLRATEGTATVVDTELGAVVLPAGQRLVFVTRGEHELQRVDLAANDS